MFLEKFDLSFPFPIPYIVTTLGKYSRLWISDWEIGRERRLKLKAISGIIGERKRRGMEHKARRGGGIRSFSIERIPHDRVPDARQMHADLMRAAGQRAYF